MGDREAVDPATLELGLPDLFRRAVRLWPERTAAAFPGERVSYDRLYAQALEVGERLVRAGVGPGDHVGLLLPNSGRFLATLLGIGLCGAVPVPLNTRFRTDELPYVVEHADLVGLVTVSGAEVNPRGDVVDYPARLAAALPSLGGADAFCAEAPLLRFVAAYGPADRPWITPWTDPAPTTLADPVPSAPVAPPGPAAPIAPGGDPAWLHAAAPGDPALLLYTSGTTARPKGVLTSHRALVTTCALGMVGRLGMTADDVVWSPAPLCHIGAHMALVGALATGGRFVTAPFFDPDAAVDLLAAEGVTIAFAGFPAFYLDLARALERTGRTLPELRVLTTAAAPAEIERVRAGLPDVLQLSLTGSTELSGSICLSDRTDTAEQRASTAGRPLDGIEVSVRDERGEQLPAGGTGEIWVRGYCLLTGYHRDPAPALTADGWYRTGDLGAMVDGRLSFRGRLKDMVKVGGENVAAAEVEGFLLRHPAVALVQVVGGPDDRLGEVPVAFIEVAPGQVLTEAAVLDFCRGALAAYKVPRAVRFVTEWPTSATKISKPALRALLAEPG